MIGWRAITIPTEEASKGTEKDVETEVPVVRAEDSEPHSSSSSSNEAAGIGTEVAAAAEATEEAPKGKEQGDVE